MYFSNPDIILSDTDVVLGSVRVGEEISFLNLFNRISSVIEYHIRKDVEQLMSSDISYRRALTLTANKAFGILETFYEVVPIDEAHLAELIMQSRNFEMWQSDVKNRFMKIHQDKITVETKIPSVMEGGMTQEEIKAIVDEVTLDTILAKLAMYVDIGNPSNLY